MAGRWATFQAMAHRRLKLPPPSEKVAAEIQRALIIKVDLDVPKEGDFQGYVREGEIMDLTKPQRKAALRMSELEQYCDWQTQVIVDLHAAVRQLDVRVATAEYERDEARKALARQKIGKAVLKWLGVTLGAGLIAAFARTLMEWLAK